MKALSVRQPWAWLIVQAHKDVENRPWQTSYRGPLLIHASRAVDERAVAWLRELGSEQGVRIPATFEVGGIVGRAVLADCVDHSSSEWFCGPLGFVLEDAEPIPFWPCKGRLGLFEVDYPPPHNR